MNVLVSLAFLLCIGNIFAEDLWTCDFEAGACGSTSTYRMQPNHQITRYWNLWRGMTPTGVTHPAQSTGPKDKEHQNGYMYFESSRGPYDGEVYNGSVTFHNINYRGRSKFVITGKYLAFGNDGDFIDADMILSTGEQLDLPKKAHNQYRWTEFSLCVTVPYPCPIPYFDITFRVKACGKLGDFAIDDLKVSDFEPTDCDGNTCSNTHFCQIGNAATTCEPKCGISGTHCHENDPAYHTKCVASDAREHECHCDEHHLPMINDREADLQCYESTLGCDFEHDSRGDICVYEKNEHSFKSTAELNDNTNVHMWNKRYCHPSLDHGKWNSISNRGFIYTASDKEIYLRIPENQNGKKLSFFYIIGDNVQNVKAITVSFNMMMPHSVEVPINRELSNRWVLFEIMIPFLHTPSAENMITAKIAVTFWGPNVEVGIDNLRITEEGETNYQQGTSISKKFGSKHCITMEYTDFLTQHGIHGRTMAYLSVNKDGHRQCSCPPTYEFYHSATYANEMVCQKGNIFEANGTACNVQGDCTGLNTECTDNLCVCKANYRTNLYLKSYSDNNPSLPHHHCVKYECDSNPCGANAQCQDHSNSNMGHFCYCPDGELIASGVLCNGDGVAKVECNFGEGMQEAGCTDQTAYPISTFHFQMGALEAQAGQQFDEHLNEPIFYEIILDLDSEMYCTFDYKRTNEETGFLSVWDGTGSKANPDNYIDINTININVWNNFGVLIKQSTESADAGKNTVRFRIQGVTGKRGENHIDNLKCYQTVHSPCENTLLDPHCSSSARCTYDHASSATDNRICLCPIGFSGNGVQNDGGCTVLPRSQTCHNCNGHIEYCGDMGECRCRKGFFRMNPNEPCRPIHDCDNGHSPQTCGDNGVCIDILNQVCLCNPAYEYDIGARKCIMREYDSFTCPNTFVKDVSSKECGCLRGSQILARRDNGEHACDHNGIAGLAPVNGQRCSSSCGPTGTIIKEYQCVSKPTYSGFPCIVTDTNRVEESCNTHHDCPASPGTCSIMKDCAYCGGVEQYAPGDKPEVKDLEFDYVSKLSATFTYLAKWNKQAVEKMCSDANCVQDKISVLLHLLKHDIGEIKEWGMPLQKAVGYMEKILDCHASLDNTHNENFWEVFDKLCELKAYIPHAIADLEMKRALLTHEKERCDSRSDLHVLINQWKGNDRW